MCSVFSFNKESSSNAGMCSPFSSNKESSSNAAKKANLVNIFLQIFFHIRSQIDSLMREYLVKQKINNPKASIIDTLCPM